MDNNELLKKITEFIPVKKKGIEERTFNIRNITMSNLRDSLIGLGTILDEDCKLNSYVVNVGAGAANMNGAIVAVQIIDNSLYILAYAKEGIINQKTAKKAIDKTVDRLKEYII